MKNSSHWSHWGATTADEEKLRTMFQKQVRGNETRLQYCLFHSGNYYLRMDYFLNKWQDMAQVALAMSDNQKDKIPFSGVISPKRFAAKKNTKDIIPAEVYILSQVLLWSRFSKKDYEQLIDLLSNNNETKYVQIRPGNELDARRWTMNFYHNVIDSVYYSYKIWKLGYFVHQPTFPIQNNPTQIIYLSLLGSAIEKCSHFYKKLGVTASWNQPNPNPKKRGNASSNPLQESKSVIESIHGNRDNFIPNVDTFLTTSHIF